MDRLAPASLVWRLRQWLSSDAEYSDAPTDATPGPGLAEWRDFWRPIGGILLATEGVPRCARLQSLVRLGVPPEERAAMWRLCAAPDSPRAGRYQALLVAQQASSGTVASRQIDKDLHRTFGSVPEVRVPQQEALASLRNVLTACAPPRLLRTPPPACHRCIFTSIERAPAPAQMRPTTQRWGTANR